MAIATINPATGQTLQTFDEMSEADVERRLAGAATAAATYRLTSFADRAGWMDHAADILDEEQNQIAAMMTTEMGKTLAAARRRSPSARRLPLLRRARSQLLADEPADADAVGAANAYVTYEPLGPVLAIMPWNFPLWQAMRFAVPGADGRQRRPAQARLERAADRAVHPGPVRPGRVPWEPSRPCSSAPPGSSRSFATAG